MKALFTWIFLLIITCCFLRLTYGEELRNDEQVLGDYVDWFHRNMRPSFAKRAKDLIPIVLKHSTKYRVDPLTVASIISFESSWRNFEGALGEVGPMHVMPGKWSKQFDLTTLDGQTEAGVYRWNVATKCGVLHKALTHYAAGGCSSKSARTKKKMDFRRKYIIKMNQKFRKKRG